MELAMPSVQSRLMATAAGLWRNRGASSPAWAPSTTVTEWPASSTARLTAVSISGRPLTRTSCLVEPKRDEAPAASTTTWMWLESVPVDSITGISTAREQPDREHGQHAHAGDHRRLAGHLRERRSRDHVQDHENGEHGERDDDQAGQQPGGATLVSDLGIGLLGFEVHAGILLSNRRPGVPGGLRRSLSRSHLQAVLRCAVRQRTPHKAVWG